MNITIKPNAFKGLVHLNGQKAVRATDKTGKPIIGVSGKTQAFSLMGHGRVFLTPAQFTEE